MCIRDRLDGSREMKDAFGDDVINSYIKLKNQEIDSFSKDEVFDKRKPVSSWEKENPQVDQVILVNSGSF